MTDILKIRDFLGQRRLAMVGVSREPMGFSRGVFHEFRLRGYDVAPVNPKATEIEGQPCFAHLGDVQPPVDTALLMTPPAATQAAVEECAAAGITRVWMYRANNDAIRFCESHGISVIAGECPLMFLPQGAWFHRFHGFLRKIACSYPR
jgi:uncharacterized protein